MISPRGAEVPADRPKAVLCAGGLRSSTAISALKRHGLFLTFLIAPTTPPARAQALATRSGGFVYVVSRMGVTGTHAGIGDRLRQTIEPLRDVTKTPIAVGFGISTPEQFAAVGGYADAGVVGSAIVETIERNPGKEAQSVAEFVGQTLSAACSRNALHV